MMPWVAYVSAALHNELLSLMLARGYNISDA
jgi:hypothetical protein